MFSFEQLRAFVAVAEHLHFGNAARELRMTQPPLSRQIQNLETDLGVQLFVRTNRKVSLTVEGEAFVERAKQLLDLADSSRSLMQGVARGERGRLVVGFTSGASLAVLGDILTVWQERLPDVDVVLHEHVSRDQLAELAAYRYDIGLIRPLADPDIFETLRIHEESMVVAVPEGHPLADGAGEISVDEVARESIIGYARPDSEYFVRKLEGIFADRSVRVVQRAAQIHSVIALVAAGFGLAIVPRSAARMEYAGVVYRDLAAAEGQPAAYTAAVDAVWRRDSSNPALARAISAMRDVLGTG